jgi:hypothetical protein
MRVHVDRMMHSAIIVSMENVYPLESQIAIVMETNVLMGLNVVPKDTVVIRY